MSIELNEAEKELDKSNPHYVHNLFMRNANIWNDDLEQWTMTKDVFETLFNQWQLEQLKYGNIRVEE